MSQASILVSVLSGIIYYAYLSRLFKGFFAFLVLTVFFEIQSNIAVVLFHNNMPGLHVYTFVEMLAFSFMYYSNWSERKILKSMVVINMLGFIAVSLADAFFISGFWTLNTNSRTYASVSLTIYALVYFYGLFKEDSPLYSWQQPFFWLSLTVLIYFGLNTFYFMLASHLFNIHVIGNISSYTHAAVNIFSNCLIAQAFRCHKNLVAKL